MSNTAEHWDAAYAQGDSTRGWYQVAAVTSTDLISRSGIGHDDAIIDIGGGASVLVDDLLDAGFADITVLDQSPAGLAIARQRLGPRADPVTWIATDLLAWQPDRHYALWHDRAVSHFLLEDAERRAYRALLRRATTQGSTIVLGAFGPLGPDMCAGLPVRRIDLDGAIELLGDDVTILEHRTVDHVRPDGDTQQYLWVMGRRTGW